jgi:hypothetical protein
MKSREIRAKVNSGSLGTKSARAARRSIPEETARRIVARAERQWTTTGIVSRRSGG